MGTKLKSQSGASAVEFGIVLPVLVVLVFGIIEFSVIFYDKAMVTNASREGARAGIVFNVDSNGDWIAVDDTTIRNKVISYLQNYLINLGDPAATVDIPDPVRVPDSSTGRYSPGGELRVTVRYTYTYLVLPNFVTSLISPVTLTAQTAMRFE